MWADAACRSQPHDNSGAGCYELLCNQNRIGSPDRPGNDAAGRSFHIHREHRSMKARPCRPRLNCSALNKVVREVSVKLEHTNIRNADRRKTATDFDGTNERFGGKSARCFEWMSQERDVTCLFRFGHGLT